MPYKSFAITIRPRLGLNGDFDDAIMKWFRSHKLSAYVHEMEDEARHLHGQIWLEEPKDINDIRKAIYRISKKCLDPQGEWTPAAQRVQCGGIKIAYNDDFCKKYMNKDCIELEYANQPVLNTSTYYPSAEEQLKAQKKATRVADAYFNRLKDLWLEKNKNYTEWQFTSVDIADFYYDQMFRDKTIAVICDSRQRKQKAECLYHYIYPNNDKTMVLTEKAIDQYNLLKDFTKTT